MSTELGGDAPWWSIVEVLLVCVGLRHRATLITFINPAVAIGAVVLGEQVTLAPAGGFVLVISGCWFATRHGPEVIPDSAIVLETRSTAERGV